MNRYHGRVVAITGAAQGVGLAMATRFAAEGATVALADVNEQTLTDAAKAITNAHHAKLSTDVVDVTDSAQVNAWITGVTAGLGRLDVLVNNAGIIRDNRVEDTGVVLDVDGGISVGSSIR
ncbi:SDR family NAD(P)-dependent oxidoreductase [Streptomyces sp. ME18-1-4]|uniref:SDR family NAD(P)-dependent oxidoreductase n=1 Tax=Streptomyces sp. ME18-1-4 TaxID=3028685 RepID=UPI0029A9FFBA|nr:SDR family NAD(P)-dependent oxidoreductase [Streptomyces sp. ME18-1-4]MDX3242218.1 SDR family NAD(P)-dependent oxidoreductase [Streptomyces sp. ME18-1-4]